MNDLHPTAARILTAVCEHHARYGRGPAVAWLAWRVGRDVSTVHGWLMVLARAGYIEHTPHTWGGYAPKGAQERGQ